MGKEEELLAEKVNRESDRSKYIKLLKHVSVQMFAGKEDPGAAIRFLIYEKFINKKHEEELMDFIWEATDLLSAGTYTNLVEGLQKFQRVNGLLQEIKKEFEVSANPEAAKALLPSADNEQAAVTNMNAFSKDDPHKQTILILQNAKRLFKKKDEFMQNGLNISQFDELIRAALLDFTSCLADVDLDFDRAYGDVFDLYFTDKISEQNVVNILVGEIKLYKEFDVSSQDYDKLYQAKRELRENNGWN